MNGTCLCITYILLDIFHCWACVTRAENYGAEENDLWNGGGVLTFQGFVGIVLIANMMFAKVFPVFLSLSNEGIRQSREASWLNNAAVK